MQKELYVILFMNSEFMNEHVIYICDLIVQNTRNFSCIAYVFMKRSRRAIHILTLCDDLREINCIYIYIKFEICP